MVGRLSNQIKYTYNAVGQLLIPNHTEKAKAIMQDFMEHSAVVLDGR